MNYEKLGRLLKEARENAGLTQWQIAGELGVTPQNISSWERGRSKIDIESLLLLCRKYKTSFEDMLNSVAEDPQAAPSSPEELQLMEHFRSLDAYGKAIVRQVTEQEAQRSAQLRRMESGALTLPLWRPQSGAPLEIGDLSAVKLQLNALTEKCCCCLVMPDDSMFPRYRAQDILLVSSEATPLGEAGLFLLQGKAYVRILGRRELKAVNPDFAPLPLQDAASLRTNRQVLGVLDSGWMLSAPEWNGGG